MNGDVFRCSSGCWHATMNPVPVLGTPSRPGENSHKPSRSCGKPGGCAVIRYDRCCIPCISRPRRYNDQRVDTFIASIYCIRARVAFPHSLRWSTASVAKWQRYLGIIFSGATTAEFGKPAEAMFRISLVFPTPRGHVRLAGTTRITMWMNLALIVVSNLCVQSQFVLFSISVTWTRTTGCR